MFFFQRYNNGYYVTAYKSKYSIQTARITHSQDSR